MLISQNDIHRFELQGLIIHKQMGKCGWWIFSRQLQAWWICMA